VVQGNTLGASGFQGGGNLFMPLQNTTTQGQITSTTTLTFTPQGGASTPIPSVPACLLGTIFWKL
jgi:hypothetical protein